MDVVSCSNHISFVQKYGVNRLPGRLRRTRKEQTERVRKMELHIGAVDSEKTRSRPVKQIALPVAPIANQLFSIQFHS